MGITLFEDVTLLLGKLTMFCASLINYILCFSWNCSRIAVACVGPNFGLQTVPILRPLELRDVRLLGLSYNYHTTPIPIFFIFWVTLYRSMMTFFKRSMRFIATSLVSSCQLVKSIASYCIMFERHVCTSWFIVDALFFWSCMQFCHATIHVFVCYLYRIYVLKVRINIIIIIIMIKAELSISVYSTIWRKRK